MQDYLINGQAVNIRHIEFAQCSGCKLYVKEPYIHDVHMEEGW